jgi:hypothetical protein
MDLHYLLKKKKYVLTLLKIILAIIIAFNLYILLLNIDGSFRSKFGILDGMKKIYDYNLNNILCGFGFGKGEYSYSYIENGYGHLHIAVITGQYGILGAILFIIFFSSLLFQTKGKCFYVVLAFIISGFSLMSFDSSLFWSLGIISVLCKRNNYLTRRT